MATTPASNVVSIAQRVKKATDPATMMIRVALNLGRGMGKIKMTSMSWPGLCDRLSEPFVDQSCSLAAYEKMSRDERGERKGVAGFFVGADFNSPLRHKPYVTARTLVNFDIDKCSPKVFRQFLGELPGCPVAHLEYFLYTSRSHTPEHPHFRLIFPQTAPAPTDQGEAAARILAQIVDPEMLLVDAVSFRINQLMYFPSRCHDGEFRSYHNRGALLDVDSILADYQWHLTSKPAPRTPNEAKDYALVNARKGDPTKKENIVGAFCRVWSIERLIEEKFSHIYQEVSGEPGKYTYAGASGAPGIRLYDDGLHIHSFHNNDPIAGRNLNAWDLASVCLKFTEKNTEEQTEAYDKGELKFNELPSWKAMEKWAKDDPAVMEEHQAFKIGSEAILDEFAESMPVEDTEAESDAPEVRRKVTFRKTITGWEKRLDVDSDGNPRSTTANIAMILSNDVRLANAFRYNTMTDQIVRVQRIYSPRLGIDTGEPRDHETGTPLDDNDLAALRGILSSPRGKGKTGYGLNASLLDLNHGLRNSVSSRRFHPIQDMVRSLDWDGKKRIDTFWSEYCGATDTPTLRLMARNFFIGLMARAFEPGHKFDFVPVLKGKQGRRKSSVFRILAGDRYFAELRTGFDDDKRFYEAIAGKWIVEIPELSTFSKGDFEAVKAALSSMGENVRTPYEVSSKMRLRTCVFGGTTNRDEFLRDKENRRFWVIEIPDKINGKEHKIDTGRIGRERPQLLAEAYQAYVDMSLDHDRTASQWLDLSLPDEHHKIAEKMANKYRVDDGSEDASARIQAWLDTPISEDRCEPGWRPDFAEMGDADCSPKLVYRKYVTYADIQYFVFDHKSAKPDDRLFRQVQAAMVHIQGWRGNVQHKSSRKGGGDGRNWKCFMREGRMPEVSDFGL